MQNINILKISDIIDDFSNRFRELSGNDSRKKCISIFNPSEKTPSMHMNLESNLFYCFSAGKGGNSRTLLSEILNNEHEEIKYLIDKNIYLPEKRREPYNSKELKAIFIFSEIEEFGNYNLINDTRSSSALDYLHNTRKISNQSIEFYRIGYIPESSKLLDFLQKNGEISIELLEELGIFINGEFILKKRILLPLYDKYGNTVSFESRDITDGKNKHIRLGNIEAKEYKDLQKSRNFYRGKNSESEIRRKSEIIIVEGPFDLIALGEKGVHNVYSLLTNQISEERINHLSQNKNRLHFRIIVMMDQDVDEKENYQNVNKKLILSGFNNVVRFRYDGIGKDPDEYFKNIHDDTYTHIIDRSVHEEKEVIEILVNNFLKDNSFKTSDLITQLEGPLMRNYELIDSIKDEIVKKRPAEIDEFVYLIEQSSSETKMGIHFLASKLNLEVAYAKKILDEVNTINKEARDLMNLEQVIADYILDELVRKEFQKKDGSRFGSHNVKRSSLSKNYDTLNLYGKSSIKVENEKALFFEVEFDYLEKKILISRRYRILNGIEDNLSKNKSLFVSPGEIKGSELCDKELKITEIKDYLGTLIEEIKKDEK